MSGSLTAGRPAACQAGSRFQVGGAADAELLQGRRGEAGGVALRAEDDDCRS